MIKSGELTTLGRIFHIFCRTNIHPAYLIIPIVLSAAAAAFEGVGMGLLIPLLEGFFTTDYSFAKETKLLGMVINLLPEWVKAADKWLFAALLGFFAFATVCKNVFRYLSNISISYIGLRAAHHLRKLLFSRYLSFGKLYFDSSHVGHHSAVMSQYANQALGPLLGVGKHINALFSLSAYLIILSLISWKLTLFALPLLFVLHVMVRRLIVLLRRLSQSIVESINALSQKTIEILSTISLVRASNMEAREQERYTKISDRQTRLDFKKSMLQNLLIPMQELMTLFAILALFVCMIYLMVRNGGSSAPSFIVYFYLVMNATAKFGTLTTFRSSLASVLGVVDEVENVLDDEGKFFVPSGSKKFTGLEKEIEFKETDFVFPNGNAALNNLSFSVAKGSMTAIVGPTGAGKTTIINLLLRFYDCPAGTIFLDGEDIRNFDCASLRKGIALVSQDTLLLHDTLRNNITYGLNDVSEDKLENAVKKSRLSAYVKELPEGLDTLIGDRGVKLSGGEKQRVSIARALLKESDILILDEATSSLDSSTEKLIQEAIDDAVVGRTSIVIAHRFSTIKHADHIVVINEGSVAEEGGLDDLVKSKGLFAKMWEDQKFS